MQALLPIVALVISTASLSWVVFVALRKRDLSRAVLELDLGFTGAAAKIEAFDTKTRKRKERTTLILVGKLEPNETGVFPLHLALRNTGKTPVKNAQVSLNYPADHLLADLSLITKLKFADKRPIRLRPEAKERHTSRIGHIAQSVHEYALFRPGEGVHLAEPVIFRNLSSPIHNTQHNMAELRLESRMHCSGVAGYFPLDVFVAAENCQPTTRRFNVLWINQEIGREEGIIDRVARGFWGELPKPGVYDKFFWEKPFARWEEAEILHLNLAAATHQGRRYKIAEWEPDGFAAAKLFMPTWNYHDERRPKVEARLNPVFSWVRKRLFPPR